MFILQITAIPKEPEIAADITMPTAPIPATPITPIYATPTAPISATPTAPISIGPGPILTAPSQFEVGSSSAMVPDPVSEAVAFFTRFDQPKVNDLDLTGFWDAGSPYVDFHGFWVP